MTEDREKSEKKFEPRSVNSVDAVAGNLIIVCPENQTQWKTTQEGHVLPDGESATHQALTPEFLSVLRSKGLAEKFEILDEFTTQFTKDVGQSYIDGLKAVSTEAKSPADASKKQGEFSIKYITQKCLDLMKSPADPEVPRPPVPPPTNPTPTKMASSQEFSNHARWLGETHPRWWENVGKIHKCNLFVDRVFRDLKIPLPWDESHIPRVHNMHPKLAASPDWEIVFTGKAKLESYRPQPGDLVIWDKILYDERSDGKRKPIVLMHSAVIADKGSILYAGSDSEHGYADKDFKLMCQSKSFGIPTFIFRSKHLLH